MTMIDDLMQHIEYSDLSQIVLHISHLKSLLLVMNLLLQDLLLTRISLKTFERCSDTLKSALRVRADFIRISLLKTLSGVHL